MFQDTIVALATPTGVGAIAVIRVSGVDAINICSRIFKSKTDITEQETHTIHFGNIVSGKSIIDEVLVSVFRTPNSYTGENSVEISCHGSVYIQQKILQLLIETGARMANAGEFTQRAFLNGKMDLSKAEAVADLISSQSEASHRVAMQQLRGGFYDKMMKLREELLNFASLIELELDFAEEDVEFADKNLFYDFLNRIEFVLNRLINSFAMGNVIKNGIPVAIIGEPNVGKSTLLNALLNEERAIVSEIAGTTRDTIEDVQTIEGIEFRFIDTAGIRDTKDVIESMGIQKTFEKISKSQIILYITSLADINKIEVEIEVEIIKIKTEVEKISSQFPEKRMIIVGNKKDMCAINNIEAILAEIPTAIMISAKHGYGINNLKRELLSFIGINALTNNETIVTNVRHYDSLIKILDEIKKIKEGLDTNIPTDLIAIDIKEALYQIGTITGQISNEELLGNIFGKFCIGK